MCIIIIKQKRNRVSNQVLKNSARKNPHGLGVVWLDTFKVSYHKSEDYNILKTDRPFIAHFRYATIGKVCKENTHPFVCGRNKNELLMMNGTIRGLGNKNTTDTQDLAIKLGKIDRHQWKHKLAEYNEVRFATINTRNRTFQIYNKHLWTHKDKIWYSKDNVFTTYNTPSYVSRFSGNVGIGTANPQTTLDVSGVVTATTYRSSSDYRIKHNVMDLLESRVVDNLRPVEYDLYGAKHDIGFLAHELQEHYPFLVLGEKDGKQIQSINYNGLIGILVKEIQELKREIKEIKEKVHT